MYKIQTIKDNFIIEAVCQDVDEYNIYGLEILFFVETENGEMILKEPKFDFDEMEELQAELYEKFIEKKYYPEVWC